MCIQKYIASSAVSNAMLKYMVLLYLSISMGCTTFDMEIRAAAVNCRIKFSVEYHREVPGGQHEMFLLLLLGLVNSI